MPLFVLVFYLTTIMNVIPTKLVLGRIQEYRADSYPAKYGYGQDLISALQKLTKYYKEKKESYGLLHRIFLKLSSLIGEHPNLENRVKNILTTEEIYKGSIGSRIASLKKAIKEHLE